MRTTILLALLVSILTAQAEPKPVTSEIKSVKVFLSGAQITRHASASITAGVTTLRFTGISRDAEPSSIQVSGQGAFTILSV